MAVLAIFIMIGFTVSKLKAVGPEAAGVLSKLESAVFIPALVMGTFISNFTTEKLGATWKILLFSTVITVIGIFISILCAKIASRDPYIKKIYTYGLAFANFGFMGIPIVSALFPQYEMYYIIFTLPLWTFIYVWGVPTLLMGKETSSLGDKLRALANPMFVALLIGAIIGISGLKLPDFVVSAVNTCGNCMSPLAMIITGMTFANMDVKRVLSDKSIYFISVIRLVVFPLLFGGVYLLVTRTLSLNIPEYFFICMICAQAMPLGLNTVVVPAAYGKDTSVAAGMALISHVISIITIPIILTLFGL